MEILIAIAHILGSIIVFSLWGFVLLLFEAWDTKRNQKLVAEETSIALGVRVDDLGSEELAPKELQLLSEKFSTELFRNRISDFCGLIRTIWGWLENLTQALVLLAVIWYTITDSTDNAIYAWFIIGIAMVFWVTSVIFSLTCKLLTGRYPNQARVARKFIAEWVKNNSELLKSHHD